MPTLNSHIPSVGQPGRPPEGMAREVRVAWLFGRATVGTTLPAFHSPLRPQHHATPTTSPNPQAQREAEPSMSTSTRLRAVNTTDTCNKNKSPLVLTLIVEEEYIRVGILHQCTVNQGDLPIVLKTREERWESPGLGG